MCPFSCRRKSEANAVANATNAPAQLLRIRPCWTDARIQSHSRGEVRLLISLRPEVVDTALLIQPPIAALVSPAQSRKQRRSAKSKSLQARDARETLRFPLVRPPAEAE